MRVFLFIKNTSFHILDDVKRGMKTLFNFKQFPCRQTENLPVHRFCGKRKRLKKLLIFAVFRKNYLPQQQQPP